MKRWLVITMVDIHTVDGNGDPIMIPAGAAVNEILWDGVTPFEPPIDTRIEKVTSNQTQ